MNLARSLWLALAVVLGLSLAAHGGVTVTSGGVAWPLTVTAGTAAPQLTGPSDLTFEITSATSRSLVLSSNGGTDVLTLSSGFVATFSAGTGNTSYVQMTDADVAHSMTGAVPATCFHSVGWYNATGGGVLNAGWSDVNTVTAHSISGYMQTASTSVPAVQIEGWKWDGGTSVISMSGTDMVMGVRAGITMLWSVNATGQITWADSVTPSTAHLLGPTTTDLSIRAGTGRQLALYNGDGNSRFSTNSTGCALGGTVALGTGAISIGGRMTVDNGLAFAVATPEILGPSDDDLFVMAGGTTRYLALGTNGVVQIQIDPTNGVETRAGASTGVEARVGGSMYVSTAQTANVGTGEDNLSAYTVPAATLNANGDFVRFSAAGTFAATVNAKTVKVKFGATTLFSTGAIAVNSGEWTCEGTVIRTGATTQKAYVTFTTNNALLVASTDYTAPGETLSGTVVIQFTGEATDNADITQEALTVEWVPGNT